MLGNNWFALIATFLISLLWLRIIDYLAHRGLISSHISRKIIHIGTGLFFILCWILFPENNSARFFAAFVPFIITLQFFLIGIGLIKDQSSVDAMSRTGDRREILRGPLYYGIVFVLLTIFFWKDSPTGIIALVLLSVGDGLAEIIGQNFKSIYLPWSGRKTLLGSLSMFFGSTFFIIIIIIIFNAIDLFQFTLATNILKILAITITATIVESLTNSDIDNITVPGIAVILGQLLFSI